MTQLALESSPVDCEKSPDCLPVLTMAGTNRRRPYHCVNVRPPLVVCATRTAYIESLPLCPVCDDGCRIFPGPEVAGVVAGDKMPDGSDMYHYVMGGGRMDACIWCFRIGEKHPPPRTEPSKLGGFKGSPSKAEKRQIQRDGAYLTRMRNDSTGR